ncbi:hypothetical protein AGIG_G17212 [Arapaima gigas]
MLWNLGKGIQGVKSHVDCVSRKHEKKKLCKEGSTLDTILGKGEESDLSDCVVYPEVQVRKCTCLEGKALRFGEDLSASGRWRRLGRRGPNRCKKFS